MNDLFFKIKTIISKGKVKEAEKILNNINQDKLNDRDLFEFVMTYAELMEKKGEDKVSVVNYYKEKISNLNENKYLLLYEIAKIYQYYIEDNNNAIIFYTKSLNQNKDNDEIKGEIFFCLGNLYSDNGNYEVSNDYYKESLGVFNKIRTKEAIEYVEFIYRLLGSNAEDNNDFNLALKFYKKAESISQELYYPGIASSLIAALYLYKLDKEDYALKYALKAEKIIQDKIYQIGNYQLLSQIYSSLNDYETSLNYSNKIIKEFPDFENISDIYKDIGTLYYFWSKYDLAIKNFNIALNKLSHDSDEYNNKFIYYSSWLAIAEKDGGSINKAINILNSLINQYPEKVDDLLFPKKILAECMCKQGRYLDAYNLVKKAIKEYENSAIFESDDEDYNYAIKLKEEVYKKLPIINRIINKYSK